jgi:DNA-binding transcriptional ArsR family regulator
MDIYQRGLDALGDPTRRAIVESLLEGPKPVGELARGFPISRPAISHHLRILKEANLVIDQAVGNRRLYSLNPEGIDLLRDYFDRFWMQALKALENKLEESEDEHK